MAQFQCVGVDVSKDKFDVAIKVNNQYKNTTFSNDKKGYRAFAKWLDNINSPWVCMEATGHYSEGIADFLVEKAIRVSVVNPFQVKNFAKAKLARNKNDQLDARIIADFCQVMEPRLYSSRDEIQKELKDLTKLLDALKGQIIQLKNQLHSMQNKFAKKTLIRLIKQLEGEIACIEKQIADLVKGHPELNNKVKLITSIKGVGKLTAYHILARIPSTASFDNPKQFAAYIGISPKQHQSGKLIGKTTISKIGNARLRKALYMAALVAKRHNTALKGFVSNLQRKGKAPKTIVCAVMRKLAHFIFGVLKNNLPFREDYACG